LGRMKRENMLKSMATSENMFQAFIEKCQLWRSVIYGKQRF